MKAVRIFLKPKAQAFIDMGVDEQFNAAHWWLALRKDGAALAQGAIVPVDSIHHVVLVEQEAPTNLTIIPSGKLN